MSAVKIMGFAAVVLMLLFGAPVAAAQMSPPPMPRDTYQIFYEDEDPNQIALFLYKFNLCIERVAQMNPHLDMNNLSYGARLTVPRNEPCYDYQYGSFASSVSPPRLKYYENGDWLKTPYYSPNVAYTYTESIEALALRLNICEKELLAENIAIQLYPVLMRTRFASLDVFLPENITCRLHSEDEKTRAAALLSYRQTVPGGDYVLHYLKEKFGLCYEQVDPLNSGFMWGIYAQAQQNHSLYLTLPAHAPPCFDEDGRRLAFYDIHTGLPLDEPYYTDFEVYAVQPNMRVEDVAAQLGVCVFDLMRLNGFVDMTFYRGTLDVLVPPVRPCDSEMELVRFPLRIRGILLSLTGMAAFLNVCPATLVAYNPQVVFVDNFNSNNARELVLILPVDRAPCYAFHRLMPDETVYDLERLYNVCHEEFLFESVLPHYPLVEPVVNRKMYYIPREAMPCYNDDGQRLEYPPEYDLFSRSGKDGRTPTYNPLALDIFRAGDTVYAVSQRNNVCVHDILAANPALKDTRPRGLAVFIPDTRPCYDTETGLPLIYKDAQGQPLPEPVVGDKLYYYGSQPMGRISYYYNICANRIADVNVAKMRGMLGEFPGWLIPTERPPCYDEKGEPIYYACYDYPLDMTADYRDARYPISINRNGTYCYDLRDPETIIWQHNRPYIIVDVRTIEDWPLSSNAFIASCFGVSHAETNAINENVTIREILPYQTKAIPLPTRDCYQTVPVAHERWGMTTHVVQRGDTVSTIGARYNVPWPLITQVNQLGPDSMLFINQKLVIPDTLYRGALVLMGGLAAALAAALIIRRRWR